MPTSPTISTSMGGTPFLIWLDLELRRNRVDELLRQTLKELRWQLVPGRRRRLNGGNPSYVIGYGRDW